MDLFPIPFYQEFLNKELYNQIKAEVKDYISKNPQNFKEAWDCPTKSDIEIGSSLKCTPLTNFILDSFKKYLIEQEYDLPLPKVEIILQLWVNIAPKGAYQEIHQHNAYLNNNIASGTIYIDVKDDSGDFVIYNPNRDNIYRLPKSNKYNDIYRVQPKNGLLILFPSWLEHAVSINKNIKDRIAVSFNIKLKQYEN